MFAGKGIGSFRPLLEAEARTITSPLTALVKALRIGVESESIPHDIDIISTCHSVTAQSIAF
jgi:hypothetical protein